MNLILFERADSEISLPTSEPRAKHLLQVLRREIGDSFDAGVVNGPRGKGTVVNQSAGFLTVSFTWGTTPPPDDPIHLIVGMPRPQTARDLLRDATTLGVQALHFVATERSDPNYARSSLWQTGEWRRHVIAGAEQAFSTWIPTVTFNSKLADVLIESASSFESLIALDNYEASLALSRIANPSPRTLLALGPERGWATADRALLRNHGFTFAHLGQRVLRTETACVAALALLKARLGSL